MSCTASLTYTCLIFFVEIPVFCVLTNVDECRVQEEEIDDKICDALNIDSNKLLMCSNYKPDDKPDGDKDISILEFLITV